jgi:hypothetical protein
MTKERVVTTFSLDTDSANALDTMSAQLGISKSAIVRLITLGAYEHYKQNRTLPSATYRQVELGVTSG